MTFEISISGSFLKEIKVEASSAKEAEEKGIAEFDKLVGLMPDDYAIDSVISSPDIQTY